MSQLQPGEAQRYLTQPCNDRPDHWLELARDNAGALRASCEQDGYRLVRAPKSPSLIDDVALEEPFRLMCYWVPSWTPNPDAGKWIVRVDTICVRAHEQ